VDARALAWGDASDPRGSVAQERVWWHLTMDGWKIEQNVNLGMKN